MSQSPALDSADLRALSALDAYQHFTRAAESLGISQPALTKRIRQLERRLGGALFQRHAGGATPTPAGRLLCDRARVLLEDASRAEQMTREVLAGDRGLLRVGAGLSVLLSEFPGVVRAFRRQHPGVYVAVKDMSTPDQIHALRSGEIDVGFLRMSEAAPDLCLQPVLRDELRFACPAGLAHAGTVRLSRLFLEPLVLVSRSTSLTFHDHVQHTCRLAGYSPTLVHETNQMLTALLLVQAGVGLSVVPASVQRLRVPGVRILNHPLPDAAWTVGIAWHRERGVAPIAKRFVRAVKEAFPGT